MFESKERKFWARNLVKSTVQLLRFNVSQASHGALGAGLAGAANLGNEVLDNVDNVDNVLPADLDVEVAGNALANHTELARARRCELRLLLQRCDAHPALPRHAGLEVVHRLLAVLDRRRHVTRLVLKHRFAAKFGAVCVDRAAGQRVSKAGVCVAGFVRGG